LIRLKVDSREQSALEFRKGVFDEIVTEGLPWADYWCEIDGATVPLVIERKSLSDLWGTMTKGHDRFIVEVNKCILASYHMILGIEASMQTVWQGFPRSTFSGESMLKMLATLRVKYDVEVHFFNSRREFARYIEELYLSVNRYWKKEGTPRTF